MPTPNNIVEPNSRIDSTKTNSESGFNNSPLYEPSNQVIFNNSVAEKVFKGENNTWIVLGRDRSSTLSSGFGGKGHSKSGAIDIVVGRVSALDGNKLQNKKVNPSFAADAARIYISQKTNIDEYMMIGKVNKLNSGPCSAIGIKADDIRLIARNSMKLVTRTDSLLSNNKIPYETMGIQLIANNDETSLQPLVLGKNLENALANLNDNLAILIGHLGKFVSIQISFNDKISDHTHYSPFYAQKTSLDPNVAIEAKKASLKVFTTVEQELMSTISNLQSFRDTYLLAGSKDYINSKFNFTN